ncbi:MAG TPA: hypothetical protein VKB09_00480 [Thermomicrobiales bacterium]|nr:hypothetical protein [Thermomicrobiales bacterium]
MSAPVYRSAVLSTPTVSTSIRPLTRDLLAWVARQPRSYAEAMEAWRSSCPRFTIWEDALADGLIRDESGSGGTLGELQVVLTARGRAVLDGTR